MDNTAFLKVQKIFLDNLITQLELNTTDIKKIINTAHNPRQYFCTLCNYCIKDRSLRAGWKLEPDCARTQLGGVRLQMKSDDGWRGAAKLWDWCQLVVVQSPEGQTQEDGLITRRNEGQAISSRGIQRAEINVQLSV